jgi:hypothetical protein
MALRASRSRPVWKKIAVPSDAKAGEKACSTVALDGSARASARAGTISCASAVVRGTRTISRLSSTFAGFVTESFAAGAAAESLATRAAPAGVVAARRPVIPSMTMKPTANEATRAAATPSAGRPDARTGDSASRSAPTDLNISGSAVVGSDGWFEDAAGLRTTSVGRAGTIGREGRAPRWSTPRSTSRLAPFSNRASAFENSPGDPKGGASTTSSPRAMA